MCPFEQEYLYQEARWEDQHLLDSPESRQPGIFKDVLQEYFALAAPYSKETYSARV